MNKKQLIKVIWLVFSVFFGAMSIYSTYYVNPELGLTYSLGLIALSLPSGIIIPTVVQLILSVFGLKELSIAGDIFLDLLVIISGYWQWFVFVPYIKNKIKSKNLN